MCQTITTFHSCGCSGQILTQKCRSPTDKCKSHLQFPSSLKLDQPCTRDARKPRQSEPPISYHPPRNPSHFSRGGPEVPPRTSSSKRPPTRATGPRDIPTRHSSLGFRVAKPKSQKHKPALSPDLASHPALRGGNTHHSAPTRGFADQAAQRAASIKADHAAAAAFRASQRSWETGRHSDRHRRELEKQQQRNNERIEEKEKYEQFLAKDRAKKEAYQRRRAERKAGLRPGMREGIKEKSDGICSVM